MKLLVIGGAGYIGSHCTKKLMEYNITTIVLDNMSTGNSKAVETSILRQGDYGDYELLTNLFRQEAFDGVIHLAASADVADSVLNPRKYYSNNVSKMISLLDAMVDNNIRNIVFSSSAAVYGEPNTIPIEETHTHRPLNPYGVTKSICERLLIDYRKAYGLNYCTFRYFNAAGADSSGEIGESHNPERHILPLIFRAAMMRNSIFHIFGNDYDTEDGTCYRDYVHVEDLAEAHYLGIKYLMEGGHPEIFNLGNNKGYSVMQIIKKFEEITGCSLEYDIVGRREGDPGQLIASNRKAREILGWKPERSSIEKIIEDGWFWENHRRY